MAEMEARRTFSFPLKPPDPPCSPQTSNPRLQLAHFGDSAPTNLKQPDPSKLPNHNHILTQYIHSRDSS